MTTINLVLVQMNGSQQMMDGWGMGPGMFFMIFFWLLLLALIVTLIWFLVRRGSESKPHANGETPMKILKKRYARGEINSEEFQRMKKGLDS